MIDDRNDHEKTKAWLKANQVSMIIQYLMTIDTPLLPLLTLMVYSLRLSQRVKEYHYCNGELHIVYDEKGNEVWRIK